MSNGAAAANDTDPQLIDALHRIYIDSIPVSESSAVQERASDAVKALGLTTALEMLADSSLDRLQKWHVIASALHRQPALLAREGVTNSVINAIVSIPEAPDSSVDRGALERRLNKFAVPQDRAVALPPDRWSEFYNKVLKKVDGLREQATEFDAYKPGCNDGPIDAGPGVPSIVSRFWTNAPLDEMRRYVDPLNWKQLGSEYWKEMRPVEGPTSLVDGYDAEFCEVVNLPTGPVTAYLDVAYRKGEHHACTTYREAHGRDDDVEFDRGYVFATDTTVAPPGAQTLVYSTKSIIFKDHALNGFTDILCDNGWVDLMIQMALPQGRRNELEATSDGERETRAAGSADLPQTELEEWAASVHVLINNSVKRIGISVDAARQGRFDLELLDEVLTFGDDVTATVTKGAKAFREIVGRLADQGGGQ